MREIEFIYAINVCSRLSMVVVVGAKFWLSSATRSFTCDSGQNAIKSFGRSQYCTSLSIKLNRFFFFFDSIRSPRRNRVVNRCAHILRALFNGVQVILATWKLIFFIYSILLFQLSSVAWQRWRSDAAKSIYKQMNGKRIISIIPKKVIVSIYKWNYPQNGATVPFRMWYRDNRDTAHSLIAIE